MVYRAAAYCNILVCVQQQSYCIHCTYSTVYILPQPTSQALHLAFIVTLLIPLFIQMVHIHFLILLNLFYMITSLVSVSKVSKTQLPFIRKLNILSNGNKASGDVLLSGLNSARDIKVSIVSCKEIIQDTIIKQDLTPQTARGLGE